MATVNPPAVSYSLAVADELGVVKVIHVKGDNWADASVVQTWGKPDRSSTILRLACSINSATLAEGISAVVACSRKGGAVDLIDGDTGTHHSSIRPSTTGRDDGFDVVGLTFLQRHTRTSRSPKLLTATISGHLHIHSCEDGAEAAQASSCWKEDVAFQTLANLQALALDPEQHRAAVGGEGCQLQVWDLATQQRTFHAKGPKPNSVGLVDPAFVTAVAWVPDSAPSSSGAVEGGPQRVVVGTAEHKVLLYDMRVGRRVQTEITWGAARITSLEAERDGSKVWVSNATGHMEAFDLKAGRMMGALKGAGGSIRCMSLHPSEHLVASAGLDRYLRVHSAATRKSVGKVYLKQCLTAVCWLPVPQAPPAGANNAGGQQAAPDNGHTTARDTDAEVDEQNEQRPKKKKRKSNAVHNASAERV